MLSAYKLYRYDHLNAPVVTAGDCAVLIGAQNGLFPDLGCNVEGEMGGLWAGEKKVCDGFFFAIDDVPLTGADACEMDPVFTSFHYRMQEQGLHVVRRQAIPDGAHGCVIELTVENCRSAARMVEVSFTVRTDILTVAAARGEDGMELGRDVGEYDAGTQAFYARDSRNPWHAVWGAEDHCRVLQADLPQTVYGFGNTKGKGINGRLFYRLRVGAQAQATMRLYVAGGFISRSRAEDALHELRMHAARQLDDKRARLAEALKASCASLPQENLERGWNWAKVVDEWLTRRLPDGGVGLCADLPEHPSLFGEGFAQAMSALLPMGEGARVQQMLRTLARIGEGAQLAPGRVPKSVSRSGRIRQVGGVKESAMFVALVHQTLLWTGDAQFARDMLPVTGLCISYLRRATRGFEDVREDIAYEVQGALEGQAYILSMAGENADGCLRERARLPEQAQEKPKETASMAAWAAWHGRQGHVEQMIGCLNRMTKAGLPGAMREDEAQTLLCARSVADLVWPMTNDLFGFAPDAAKKTIAFAPHTPIGWNGWRLENVRIGEANVTLASERISPSQARYTVTIDQPGWTVVTREGGEEKRVEIRGTAELVLGD